jgi:hypothetical protein
MNFILTLSITCISGAYLVSDYRFVLAMQADSPWRNSQHASSTYSVSMVIITPSFTWQIQRTASEDGRYGLATRKKMRALRRPGCAILPAWAQQKAVLPL